MTACCGSPAVDERLLHERAGRTGFDAGAAGNALGFEERLLLRCRRRAIRGRGLRWSARTCPACPRRRARSANRRCTGRCRSGNMDCWHRRASACARAARRVRPRSAIRRCRARPPASRARSGCCSGSCPSDVRRRTARAHRGAASCSCSLCVRTFMPAATSVVHEAGNPLRPSISTRHTRQEPKAFSVSVAQSFGMSRAGERRRAHDRRARRHRDRRAVDLERDRLAARRPGVPRS